MRRARHLAAAALWLSARAALAAPRAEEGIGLPRDVSLDGHRIDWLIHFTIVSTTLVFVAVVAWMAYAMVRHGAGHPAAHDRGESRRSALAVLVPTLSIFLVVDGNLFGHAVVDLNRHFWNYDGAEADPAAVRIEVNAQQWAWGARYPGPDGKFATDDDVVTLNDVRIPVGAPVILQLTSTDVIHSFYLPNFRVKQDAVPGSVTRLLFQAKETGEFEIGCAQHCGPNHYKMRGVLTVTTPQAYQAWLADAAADARRAHDPDDREANWGWAWRTF
ncbi:MAG TPA: cytochrome C oxidase subunit II [Anaeromyxobacteraceae bacterium]|jgi:cytochrome c oxidase subunit 2